MFLHIEKIGGDCSAGDYRQLLLALAGGFIGEDAAEDTDS